MLLLHFKTIDEAAWTLTFAAQTLKAEISLMRNLRWGNWRRTISFGVFRGVSKLTVISRGHWAMEIRQSVAAVSGNNFKKLACRCVRRKTWKFNKDVVCYWGPPVSLPDVCLFEWRSPVGALLFFCWGERQVRNSNYSLRSLTALQAELTEISSCFSN